MMTQRVTVGFMRKTKLQPVMEYIHKWQEVFLSNYLMWSHLFAESKMWKSAGHVQDFPRYHQQLRSNLNLLSQGATLQLLLFISILSRLIKID